VPTQALRVRSQEFITDLPPHADLAMEESSPHITSQSGPQGWQVTLGGCWSAAELARPVVWSSLKRSIDELALATRGDPGSWDLRALERLDHTGAQLLWNAWGQQWPVQLQASSAQRAMLDRVARFSVPPPRAAATTWL
jgi:phospholipid/cholesterol/gamma-HCH transport system permease protein